MPFIQVRLPTPVQRVHGLYTKQQHSPVTSPAALAGLGFPFWFKGLSKRFAKTSFAGSALPVLLGEAADLRYQHLMATTEYSSLAWAFGQVWRVWHFRFNWHSLLGHGGDD